MTTFVFVHGACHGAWCWSKLTPEMEARGHRAVALDLPALGEDETPLRAVTFDSTIQRVVDTIGAETEPVVLVGHSLGGISITQAAERIPQRIRRLVYLSAALPRDGETLEEIYASPAAFPETPNRSATRSPDGLSYAFSPEAARGRFYHDCSEEDFAYCVARLKPQPLVMRASRLQLTPDRHGRIPRAYIHCEDDRSISIAMQKGMVARSPCDRVASLPTSHSPFLSAPARLAETLCAVSA